MNDQLYDSSSMESPESAQPLQADAEPVKTSSSIKIGPDWLDWVSLLVGSLFIMIGLFGIINDHNNPYGGDFYTDISIKVGWLLVAIGAAIDLRALRSASK